MTRGAHDYPGNAIPNGTVVRIIHPPVRNVALNREFATVGQVITVVDGLADADGNIVVTVDGVREHMIYIGCLGRWRGEQMPYPYAEKNELLRAALRVMQAGLGDESAHADAEAEYADDWLEDVAERFVAAVAAYSQEDPPAQPNPALQRAAARARQSVVRE